MVDDSVVWIGELIFGDQLRNLSSWFLLKHLSLENRQLRDDCEITGLEFDRFFKWKPTSCPRSFISIKRGVCYSYQPSDGMADFRRRVASSEKPERSRDRESLK